MSHQAPMEVLNMKMTKDMKLLNMQVTLDVKMRDICDLITSGIEGGIAYWCKTVKGDNTEEILKLVFTLHEEHKGKTKFTLDRKTAQRAFSIMMKECPHQLGNFLGDNADANTADCFIQCCLFEEVIYG